MTTLSLTQLLEKYDVPVPRYTSYPAVPNWQETPAASASRGGNRDQRGGDSADRSRPAHRGTRAAPAGSARALTDRE